MDSILSSHRPLLQRALETWGRHAPIHMVMEETGELLSALGKFTRGRATQADLLSEIADVRIMLAQIEVMAGLGPEEVEAMIAFKLARLKSRLDGSATPEPPSAHRPPHGRFPGTAQKKNPRGLVPQ